MDTNIQESEKGYLSLILYLFPEIKVAGKFNVVHQFHRPLPPTGLSEVPNDVQTTL